MRLFDPANVVGVFRGFSDSGMEFHADLVLPYRDELQSIPMHGQFVLVQLEHEDEAVLGRITSVAAEGRLVSPIGEDLPSARSATTGRSPTSSATSTSSTESTSGCLASSGWPGTS